MGEFTADELVLSAVPGSFLAIGCEWGLSNGKFTCKTRRKVLSSYYSPED